MPESTPAEGMVDVGLRSDVSRLLRAAIGVVRNKGVTSIADQVIVSATNFLTTVIIGRAAGQDALGAYSLAFSVMLILLCLQESLVCLPYVIQHRKLEGDDRRRFAGSVGVQATALCAIMLVVLSVATLVLFRTSAGNAPWLATAFMVAVPFTLLRDFARRMAFAHLVVRNAVVVDTVVLIVQIGGLLVLRQFGWLNASTGYLAIALACALAGLGWLWSARKEFGQPRGRLKSDIRHGWSIGGWVLGSQVVSILSSYLVYWIVVYKLGEDSAGVLAACSAIILLSNPIILGTHTYLVPRLAEALATEGDRGVDRVCIQITLFLVAVMSLFSVAAFAFGNLFLGIAYGATYVGNAVVSGLYGISALAQAAGAAPDHALWVKQRPAVSFWTGVAGVGLMTLLALAAIPAWGLLGAVSAMAVGNAVTAGLRWIAYRRVMRPFAISEGGQA